MTQLDMDTLEHIEQPLLVAAGEAMGVDDAKKMLRRLPPYTKMLELNKAMLFYGEYAPLKPAEQPASLFMLDNVNFAPALFADPLPMEEVMRLFRPAPGYGTITGDAEAGAAVLSCERARAKAARARVGAESTQIPALEDALVVTTAGATGAVHSVLLGLLLRNREVESHCRSEIVYNVPTYCLPELFCRSHGLSPIGVSGSRERRFLPTVDEVTARVGPRTLACFLTFPSNPALGSWSDDDTAALRRLVDRCQSLGVGVVVDNVFQDVCHGKTYVPELFAIADDPTLLAKVFSPSKDRPFACGYRVGYAVTDRALEPWIHQAEALTKNSSSTQGQVWLAIDSLFRAGMLEGGLTMEHCRLLEGRYLFGYGAEEPSAEAVYERLVGSGLFRRYAERVNAGMATLRRDLHDVHAWLDASACFEVLPPPDFGSMLMARVRAPYTPSSEEELFIDVLRATNVAACTASCFGLEDDGCWFRVVVGGAPADEIKEALARVERFVTSRVTAPRQAAAPSPAPQSSSSLTDPAWYPHCPPVERLLLDDDELIVEWADGRVDRFLHLWLRENCTCERCRHPTARERTVDILALRDGPTIVGTTLVERDRLRVEFAEGDGADRHVSEVDLRWLRAHGHPPFEVSSRPPERFPDEILWLAQEDILRREEALLELCSVLIREGVVGVRGLPCHEHSLERVARRIGYPWSHAFGTTFEVDIKIDTDSSAFTNLPLQPHSDIPSRRSSPGFQLLHCLNNEVEGGEFFLVDGFAVATQLKNDRADLYEMLAKTPVDFRFVSKTVDCVHRTPMLCHDAGGGLVAVRVNSFLQQIPLFDPPVQRRLYEAYREYLTRLSARKSQLRVRWQRGDLLIFDNWRYLHGRDAFAGRPGQRRLRGCYLERDEVESRIRLLLRSRRVIDLRAGVL